MSASMLDSDLTRQTKKRRLAASSSIVGGQTATVSLDQFLSQRSLRKMPSFPTTGSGEETWFRPPEVLKDLFEIEQLSDNEEMSHDPENASVTSLRSSCDGEGGNDHLDPSHTCEGGKEYEAEMEPAGQETQKAKASSEPLTCRQEFMKELTSEGQWRFLQEEKEEETDTTPATSIFDREVFRRKLSYNPAESTTKLRSLNLYARRNRFLSDLCQTSGTNSRVGASWIPHAARQHSANVQRVARAGEALTRYLAKDPDNPRAKNEHEEYKYCKDKVDRGIALDSAEKQRMNSIVRNNERREYMLRRKECALLQTNGSKEPDNCSQDQDPPLEKQMPEKGATKESGIGGREGLSSAVETGLPEEPISGDDKGDGMEEEEDEETEGEEEETEEGGEGREEGKQESNENEHCIAQEYWKYNVYRTDICDDAMEPTHLASYLNKGKAEERIISEVLSVSGSLQDRTRMELRSIFEQDGLKGQILEFASGRSMEVCVEKELIQGKRGKQPRTKLSVLPTKLYTVAEQLTDLEPEARDNNLCNGENQTKGISIWNESYVLRKHANEQASRRLLTHLIGHLEGDQKFDPTLTGKIDTDARQYLHELEVGERLFDKTENLPTGNDGRKKRVSVWVVEQLIRGPRN